MHYRPFVKGRLTHYHSYLFLLLFADINSLRNQASFSMKRLKHYQKNIFSVLFTIAYAVEL